ncbi:hypothetical protein ABZ897_01125 [Nonomuraea sp. NPDC046802]|uniref:hypothetical protein n=1 Tax=Nonomuraea sp. NPDC046802 TaxID=3154919 RepID=UPI0033DF55D8
MVERDRVIDLRTRSTYSPDCATLARNRLALARNSLGMTVEEFAATLTSLVGWPVTPDALEAWESSVVPPGDVVIAVSTMTPAASDMLELRSHKFIPAFVGEPAVKQLMQASSQDCHVIPLDHPSGQCSLHVWPFGVVIVHLVEEIAVPNIARLAVWRYRSYAENLKWVAGYLQTLTGDASIQASYVLSAYWLHSPIWVGRMLDTALRIICAPRVLVEREGAGSTAGLGTAERAEKELLAGGFEHQEMRSFGLKGVSIGYSSWSGVAYHPLDPTRSLAEDELESFELNLQALWAYCEHINRQVERGSAPLVPEGHGWRFLRAARSRLANPRPQETGQHRSMRDAVLETSGLMGHLQHAIEALREAGQH